MSFFRVKLNVKMDLNKTVEKFFGSACGLLASIPEQGVEHQLRNFQARLKEVKESWDQLVSNSTTPINPKIVKDFNDACVQGNDSCAQLQQQLVDASGRTFRSLCNQFDAEISRTVKTLVYWVAEAEGILRTTTLSQDLNVLLPVPSRNSAPKVSQYNGVYAACDRRDSDSIGNLFRIAKEDPHIKSSLQEYLVPLSVIVLGPAASRRINDQQRLNEALISLATLVTKVGVKQHTLVASLLCHRNIVVEDFIRLYVRCDPQTLRIVEQCVLQFPGKDQGGARDKLLQGLNQVADIMSSGTEVSNGTEMLAGIARVDAMQQATNVNPA